MLLLSKQRSVSWYVGKMAFVACVVHACVLIVFVVAWLFPRVVPRVVPRVISLVAVLVVPVSQANGNGVENTGWVFLKSTSL